MKTLTIEEIHILLGQTERGYVQDHYIDYDRSHWPETFDCSICGNCKTPEKCVWSTNCTRCGAGIGEYCTASDGRITSLHTERHDLALINAKVFTKASVNP